MNPEPLSDPLPTLVWSRLHDYRLRSKGTSSLWIVSRFGPLLHVTLVVWFILMAAVAAGIATGEFNHSMAFILWIACAVCLLIAVVLAFLPIFTGPFLVQSRFDRPTNQLDLAAWGIHRRQKLPLDQVSAVQLLAVGLREDDEGSYPSFQLNLVLQGDAPDCVNLIENGDAPALLQMGTQISTFLQVPLVEQTSPVPIESSSVEPIA